MDDPKRTNPQQPEDEEWTTVEGPSTWDKKEDTEKKMNDEPKEHDEDWAEKSMDEVKAGLKKISDALKYAFDEGKNDPKIKQFGKDVRSAFDRIGDDIDNIFKKG